MNGSPHTPPPPGPPHSQVQAAAEIKENNTLGIVSLVTGIIGLILSPCCGFISIPLGIAALVCGFMAKGQNQRFALAGLILGAITLVVAIIMIIIGITFNLTDLLLQ